MPSNLIIPGFNPDPSVVRVGDDYYLAASSFEYRPGIPIYHSRDLDGWELIGHVVDRPGMLDDEVRTGGGIWAPTIRHYRGRFHLIVTDAMGQGNMLFTADDAAGPWSDPIELPDIDGIDPDIAWDDDGDGYIGGTLIGCVDVMEAKPVTNPGRGNQNLLGRRRSSGDPPDDGRPRGLLTVVPNRFLVPAAYVILRRDEHVLLQLRMNTGYMDGYWATAAAGHVEAGESGNWSSTRSRTISTVMRSWFSCIAMGRRLAGGPVRCHRVCSC